MKDRINIINGIRIINKNKYQKYDGNKKINKYHIGGTNVLKRSSSIISQTQTDKTCYIHAFVRFIIKYLKIIFGNENDFLMEEDCNEINIEYIVNIEDYNIFIGEINKILACKNGINIIFYLFIFYIIFNNINITKNIIESYIYIIKFLESYKNFLENDTQVIDNIDNKLLFLLNFIKINYTCIITILLNFIKFNKHKPLCACNIKNKDELFNILSHLDKKFYIILVFKVSKIMTSDTRLKSFSTNEKDFVKDEEYFDANGQLLPLSNTEILHAVIITDFNTDKQEITIKNSWGFNWGNNGTLTIANFELLFYSNNIPQIYFFNLEESITLSNTLYKYYYNNIFISNDNNKKKIYNKLKDFGYMISKTKTKTKTKYCFGDINKKSGFIIEKDEDSQFYAGNVQYNNHHAKYHKDGFIYTVSETSSYEGLFKDNKYDGYGKYKTKENNVYTGEFKNNKICGYMLSLTNKFTYDGQIKDNEYNGFGKLSSSTILYEGIFFKNIYDGFGILRENDEIYEGQWKNDRKDGISIKSDPLIVEWYDNGVKSSNPDVKTIFENGNTYVGFINKDGKKDGSGILIYSNGIKCYGTWINDELNFGLFIWPIEPDKHISQVYYGNLKEGQRYGEGLFRFSDGSIYNGYWENEEFIKGTARNSEGFSYNGQFQYNKYHGIGTYNKGELFLDGIWKDHKFTKGTIKYPNGDMYYGEIKDNHYVENGILKEENSIYQGQWQESKKHGLGTICYFKDGMYDGSFENNKKHGYGAFIDYEEKKIYMGNWKDDKVDGEGSYYKERDTYYGNWTQGTLNAEGSSKLNINNVIIV